MTWRRRSAVVVVSVVAAFGTAVGMASGADANPAPQVAPAPNLAPSAAAGISVAPGLHIRHLVGTAPGSSLPDDLGTMNGDIFVGYQNGVGATGGSSPTGGTTSTIVEYRQDGTVVTTWSVTGKCDGLTTDPANNRVLLTVNEDGNSSMYVIHPTAAPSAQVVHLTYTPDLATVTGAGGTDAVIVQNGNVYTTGSAPTTAGPPAIYQVGINEAAGTASLTGLFNDNAPATGPNGPVTLALTDPDSANVVPASSPLYGGDIMFSSQGDSQLIFIQNPGAANQSLTQLPVGTQVNDVEWATASTGTLYVTDNKTNTVYAIDSSFPVGTVFVSAPSDSGVAGFVGTLDLNTGTITPIATGFGSPQGLLFVPGPAAPGPYGYHLAASDGGVFSFGDAGFFGSMGGEPLNQPVVGMASTSDRGGYWLAASDGGIFTFGDAGYFGSKGDQTLNKPVVGMTPTPSGQGYWLVASDGGVFTFGDAGFFGSLGGAPPAHPVVGIQSTASGKGYWLVASDGTVTPFGDASNFGSLTGEPGKTIVGFATTPSADGYWLVASDGSVFPFGGARLYGSAAGQPLNAPIVSITPTATGQGYWLAASDGGVFAYGDAQFYGSEGGQHLNAPVVGSSY
ncbi:MAG TPA: hypothetical protein VHZ02_14415 [Acidimicrobiales bacterium]|nr:hypothetical protein [Acidimicrobiales bacterium]